jgi:hypothetical protein
MRLHGGGVDRTGQTRARQRPLDGCGRRHYGGWVADRSLAAPPTSYGTQSTRRRATGSRATWRRSRRNQPQAGRRYARNNHGHGRRAVHGRGDRLGNRAALGVLTRARKEAGPAGDVRPRAGEMMGATQPLARPSAACAFTARTLKCRVELSAMAGEGDRARPERPRAFRTKDGPSPARSAIAQPPRTPRRTSRTGTRRSAPWTSSTARCRRRRAPGPAPSSLPRDV